MFCPKCGSEYRKGFTECTNCKVSLVSKLPSKSELDKINFQEVLSTFNIVDVAIIKSILDCEKITYFFKGERVQQFRPYIEPARLMVRSDQIQKAKEILEDLKLNFMAIAISKDTKEIKD